MYVVRFARARLASWILIERDSAASVAFHPDPRKESSNASADVALPLHPHVSCNIALRSIVPPRGIARQVTVTPHRALLYSAIVSWGFSRGLHSDCGGHLPPSWHIEATKTFQVKLQAGGRPDGRRSPFSLLLRTFLKPSASRASVRAVGTYSVSSRSLRSPLDIIRGKMEMARLVVGKPHPCLLSVSQGFA